MTRVKNLIASIALVSFVSSSIVQPCFARVPFASNSRRVDANQNDDDESKGLKFRLSEGSTEAPVRDGYKPGVSTQLSPDETEAILRRMPPMEIETSEPQPFRLAERTPPPPLTGATRMVSFPATASEQQPDSSTQLQQLTNAFLYLQNYPFECSEQLASRILSEGCSRSYCATITHRGKLLTRGLRKHSVRSAMFIDAATKITSAVKRSGINLSLNA